MIQNATSRSVKRGGWDIGGYKFKSKKGWQVEGTLCIALYHHPSLWWLLRLLSLTRAGKAAKICNHLAMAISMLGVSEAFALGQGLGITASMLTNIFNSLSAHCWSSDSYNPFPGVMEGVPSSRNYDGGFSSNLMDLIYHAFNEDCTATVIPLLPPYHSPHYGRAYVFNTQAAAFEAIRKINMECLMLPKRYCYFGKSLKWHYMGNLSKESETKET